MCSESRASSLDKLQFQKDFPLNVQHSVRVHSSFQSLHWHTCCEINLIVEGQGGYLINGEMYCLQTGDIVILRPNDVHRAFETENMIMLVITFDPTLCAHDHRYDAEIMLWFRENCYQFNNILRGDNHKTEQLRQILLCIEQEYGNRAPHYQSIIRSELIRFLALLDRWFVDEIAMRDVKTLNDIERVVATIKYMENHLNDTVTLEVLSATVHISPSRFSHLFRQVVGTSPIDYLLQLRLSQALQLLKAKNKTVSEIAYECGFRSISNFNRLFVKHIGKTPSEVRK